MKLIVNHRQNNEKPRRNLTTITVGEMVLGKNTTITDGRSPARPEKDPKMFLVSHVKIRTCMRILVCPSQKVPTAAAVSLIFLKTVIAIFQDKNAKSTRSANQKYLEKVIFLNYLPPI
jgi:hypothetical protein